VETPASSATRFFHTMGDLNLPDYGQDYLDVGQAVLKSSHNVLILTGDIHCSRLTRVQPVSVSGASGKPAFEVVSSPVVHIKQGSEEAPKGSINLDTSGHFRRGDSAQAEHLVGLADRRTYATLEFKPGGPRVFCHIVFWAALAGGARDLAENTIWLV